MGLKGKRNKVEVLRFEPCLSASLFCCRFPVGAPGPVPLGHNQNRRLAVHRLPPSSGLPDSFFPGTAGRGAGGHPGGFSCSSVLDYSAWFPVFIPGRSLRRAASSPSSLLP